ncbi:MAG: peptidoglycan editing factor PgeF [Emcibacteraceae bacterium]|nr:peptidoglycan editing factor PgeF [Emcibacteraceae bacterium]
MIDYIKSTLLKKTKHGFFQKSGGCSTGIYSSLNTGTHSNDCSKLVHQNRNLAVQSLSTKAKLIEIHQTHSNVVHTYDGTDKVVEADAIVTHMSNIALSIVTADCAPVLFADQKAGIIGAAHAGWKGANSGIIENTVNAMCDLGSSKGNIIAAIGPCIAQCSYEVGPEFFKTISDEKYFKVSDNSDHYLFDLEMYIHNMLINVGILHIDTLSIDTYDKNNNFFSYRRKTHLKEEDYGRQISIILQ